MWGQACGWGQKQRNKASSLSEGPWAEPRDRGFPNTVLFMLWTRQGSEGNLTSWQSPAAEKPHTIALLGGTQKRDQWGWRNPWGGKQLNSHWHRRASCDVQVMTALRRSDNVILESLIGENRKASQRQHPLQTPEKEMFLVYKKINMIPWLSTSGKLKETQFSSENSEPPIEEGDGALETQKVCQGEHPRGQVNVPRGRCQRHFIRKATALDNLKTARENKGSTTSFLNKEREIVFRGFLFGDCTTLVQMQVLDKPLRIEAVGCSKFAQSQFGES